MADLWKQIKSCQLCADTLPLKPRPVLQLYPQSKILVAGHAPGRAAHDCGDVFRDASGDRLRAWMGVDGDLFYHSGLISVLPMAFCYPGTVPGRGDRPPDRRCAKTWRHDLMAVLTEVELVIALGQHAQKWHMRTETGGSVTQTVRAWYAHWPHILPLPHPSPRNNPWLAKNPWFEAEILPALQNKVQLLRRQAGL